MLLHNNMDTQDKIQILNNFVARKFNILVCTNVVKGAILEECNLCFNMDIPSSNANIFLRRVGRFADEPSDNATAIYLITKEHRQELDNIGAQFGISITAVEGNADVAVQ